MRNRNTSGFAKTKKVPHENHPAFFKRKGQNEVEYVTFTHSDEVDLGGKKKVKTIPLTDNIAPEERGTDKKSHAYPKVYEGKRSALGKGEKKYNLTPKSRKVVEDVFENCPREKVKYTGNSEKRAKNGKKP